jgi:hypothetical protein
MQVYSERIRIDDGEYKMAVMGLDVFRKYFDGYEDCYTIIGGTACEILMSEAELDFRAQALSTIRSSL